MVRTKHRQIAEFAITGTDENKSLGRDWRDSTTNFCTFQFGQLLLNRNLIIARKKY